MQLYLIRHAIAVGSSSSVAAVDGQRALTEVGAQKMRDHARALQQMGVEFDVVLTSPLLRAYQTAEIVCEALDCPERLRQCDVLSPGCDIDAIAEVLREHESAACVAMVGHNPDFERMATALIGGGPEPSVIFKKGAICCIDIKQLTPRPSGELIWHLTPKLLRMMAR